MALRSRRMALRNRELHARNDDEYTLYLINHYCCFYAEVDGT